MILWTEESKASVFPTRADPNPAYLPWLMRSIGSRNPNAWPFDVATAFGYARAGDFRRDLDFAERGLSSAKPALRSIMERAIAELARSAPPEGALDLDAEAATVVLDLARPWSIVPYWIAKEGLAFAFRALLRAHAFESSHFKHGYGSKGVWIEESWDAAGRIETATGWNILRGCLAVAEPDDHAQARTVAEELRSVVPKVMHPAIAFVFPDERVWVEAAARAAIDATVWPLDVGRLIATADLPLAVRLADRKDLYVGMGVLFTVLARHDDDGARIVDVAMRNAPNNDKRKAYAEALASVASQEAATLLSGWLESKAIAPLVRKYFKKHPALAEVALERVAEGKGALARAARLELEVAKPAARTEGQVEETEGTPAILSSPPWLGARPDAIVVEVAPLPIEPQILWALGEREALEKHAADWAVARHARDEWKNASTDEGLAQWVEGRGKLPLFWIGRITDTKLALEVWARLPAFKWWSGAEKAFPTILAQHGLAALPLLRQFASKRPSEAVHGLAKVRSAETAVDFAEIRVTLPSARSVTDSWLVEHAEVAATALIPQAVGPLGAKRAAAELALLLLRERGRGDVVDEVAARYGVDAAKAVAAIDPLFALPKKLPKLPPFAQSSALPPIELRAGGTLSRRATEHLLTMLAFSDPTAPYAGLEHVRQACTTASLRELGWALFERWIDAGTPAKESWAFRALGELGDDEIASRLAPKIRAWPKEKGIRRAAVGLEVLARIGTDVALMHIDRLAQGFRYASVREKAQALIQQIAAQRGLSAEELADRLTPTLGLDPSGSRTFDFGPRSFVVAFDENLAPVVRDGGGRVLADLPKAAKSDDPALARAAHTEWKTLKSDAKATASLQLARFERAMCAERTWSLTDFDRFIRRHPLVGGLVRRLLWVIERGTDRTLVRIAEDGSFAGVDDVEIEIAVVDARIGVVHPSRLSERELAEWGKVFADYELVQPFEQLARRTYAISDETGAGVKLEARDLQRLRALGWADDGESWVHFLTKVIELPKGGRALVLASLEPGYSIAGGAVDPQTLTEVSLRNGNEAVPLAQLGAIAYSELRRELSATG